MPPKPKGRPPKARNDVTVRLDSSVKRKASGVAGLLGKTLNEYLTERLGPIVDADLAELTSGKAKPKGGSQ